MAKAVPVMKRSNGPPLRAAQTIASGTPIDERTELRQQHQLDRYRQPFGHRLQHRLAGAEGAAEIALQHMAEPDEITLPDRLIQAHVSPQRSQILRRRLVGKDRMARSPGSSDAMENVSSETAISTGSR